MTERPIIFSTEMVQAILEGRKTMTRRLMKDNVNYNQSPYGLIGDRLWVKESFCTWNNKYVYKADCSKPQIELLKWKSPIYMPRLASRILLEITDITAEKIQDISEEDAISEGSKNYLTKDEINHLSDIQWPHLLNLTPFKAGFLATWCRINGLDSWTANPYVFAVRFEVIQIKGGEW